MNQGVSVKELCMESIPMFIILALLYSGGLFTEHYIKKYCHNTTTSDSTTVYIVESNDVLKAVGYLHFIQNH